MSPGAHLDELGRCPTCGCRRPTWGPEAILDAIRAWNDKHGRPPTAKGWKAGTWDHPSATTVMRSFRGWSNAIAAAGLTPLPAGGRRPEWTREQAELAFLRWVFQHGRQPSYRDWTSNTPEHPSAHTCKRLYGGWNAFVVACGYEPLPNTPLRRPAESYRRQAGAAVRGRDTAGRLV